MAPPSELQRRRELTQLTKPELIDLVIASENVIGTVEPLIQAIAAAFGEEP